MSGWPLVALRDVGTWYGGGTPRKSNPEYWTHGTVPWLSPKDMGREVLAATTDHITDRAVQGSSVRVVPAGSVAIVVRSGILERTVPVALVPFETTLNQDMKAVKPRDDIEPRWIAWALRAYEREVLRETRKAGTTVASLEWPRVLAFEIPLPPLNEQRRIVDLLEDHLSRLDAADTGVANSRARIKALRDAALLSAMDEAAASREAHVQPLGSLATVGSGMTPRKGNREFYEGGMIPWITSGDLHQGLITRVTQYVTQRALEETNLKVVPAGSLLVAMYGEGRTRGTAAELGVDATTNQACASITLHDPQLRSWVRMVLDANYSSLRRLGSGGVQPNLNLSIVRAIPVPVPDPSTRAQLLDRLAHIEYGRSRLGDELASAELRSSSLRRSLLTAAFSGRLTGTTHLSDVAETIDA